MSEYLLSQEIIRRSNASTWPEARQEWTLEKVFIQSQPSQCLCGQFPIKEICVLKNRLNGNRAEVGNVCVHQFLGLPSRKIFLALERVGRDDSKPLNPEAIEHAYRSRWSTPGRKSSIWTRGGNERSRLGNWPFGNRSTAASLQTPSGRPSRATGRPTSASSDPMRLLVP